MDSILQHFEKKGWAIIDFMDPTPAFEARNALQEKLNQLLGKKVLLEEYHKEVEDDEFHTSIQTAMTQFFRENKFAWKILSAQENFFRELVGRDLLVQANPYLRMTRPSKPQDNIGYHRDTFYGGSPFEISVLVPFVDVPKESNLQVLSGSHILSENLFPTIQHVDEKVTKGSEKHNLGFLYAPKVMDASIEEKMEVYPLKVGQALVFSLSTVHGSVENRGNVTRWSSDMRVLNALAPVDLSARPDYYETLRLSPITKTAKQYQLANVGN